MTENSEQPEPKQTDKHPNASVTTKDKPEFDDRPGKYPAAKKGLGSPDRPVGK